MRWRRFAWDMQSLIRGSGILLGVGLAALPALVQGADDTEFQAPDHSFACRVPQGWKPSAVTDGGQAALQLRPESGEDGMIQVYWTIVPGATIEQLAQYAVQWAESHGAQVVEQPRFTQVDGAPAVEMVLGWQTQDGAEARLWLGGILKGLFLYRVEGTALAPAAPATQQAAQVVFDSIQLGEIAENQELEAAIVGRWSHLEKKSMDNWVLHQWQFDASGRYQFYGDSEYQGNSVEHQESGTYVVYGSQLLVVPDGGATEVYSVELLPPDSLRVGQEVLKRD